MNRTATLPNKQQALVFWLKALDMDYSDIARRLEMSIVQVRGLHAQAQKLATTQGLTYSLKPAVEAPRVGSGMNLLKDLAKEAGLNAH
jgi:hypothetical protein